MGGGHGAQGAGRLDGGWAALWRLLRGLALFAQALFWLLLLGLLAWWAWSQRTPGLQERTVLVLHLDGAIVEQASHGTDDAWRRLLGQRTPSLPVRTLTQALDHAARDPDIGSVMLQMDGLSGGGLPVQREVAAALTRFRASGKKVVAWGLSYDQRSYLIAAHADEVYLHPMGAVLIEGYGRQRSYYREALDRLGISVQVVKAGKFKTAAEPYVANAPSAESLDADASLYRSLWAQYQEAVERARRLPAGHLQRTIDALPDSLVAAEGDLSRLALDARLVDGLMTPDAIRTLLVDRGARDERTRSFRQVGLQDYLRRVPQNRSGDAVAVVVVEGEIVDGPPSTGLVGGGSTAELLRRARENDAVKAVVLRVNSPGGSALGAELIRRELQLTRAAGKPVVVSMGDLAASGGYWVSMSADEIVADPATITGSIGVYGLLPSAAGLMDKLSVRTAGTGTTWLVDAGDPRRTPDPRFVRLVQASVDHTYADFTAKAAAARKTTREKIEAVAQGRVWSGAQARERGLVDRLGGFADALASARTRAKLPADARVMVMEPEAAAWTRWLDRLEIRLPDAAAQALLNGLPWAGAGQPVAQDLRWLIERWRAGAPWTAVVHCLCRVEP